MSKFQTIWHSVRHATFWTRTFSAFLPLAREFLMHEWFYAWNVTVLMTGLTTGNDSCINIKITRENKVKCWESTSLYARLRDRLNVHQIWNFNRHLNIFLGQLNRISNISFLHISHLNLLSNSFQAGLFLNVTKRKRFCIVYYNIISFR